MSRLIIPNSIANGQVADGNDLQENFKAISDWANGNIGSNNMSREPSERLSPEVLDSIKTSQTRLVYSWMGGATDTYADATAMTQNTWYSVAGYKAQHATRVRYWSWWLRDVKGTWEIKVKNVTASTVSDTTKVMDDDDSSGDGDETASNSQAHSGLGFNIDADDLVEIQVRRTTNNANDTLGRGTIYMESLVDIQAR